MKPNTLLIWLVVATLAGCKVVVEVPAGGTVTTESGNFLCEQGQTCEIDVDDATFDETFVAVPAESYEFRGWRKRESGLCQDEDERLAPCKVSTVGFDLKPKLFALLQDDIPFYLEPEFAAGPTTTVLFPPPRSSALDTLISVRGLASDADGIASIRVNGRTAAFAPTVAALPDGPEATEVEWQAQLEVDPGSTEIVVEVRDQAGNLNRADATPIVDYLKVPIEFSLDPIEDRIIGLGDGTGITFELVEYNLRTDTQRVIEDNLDSSRMPSCFKADTRDYVHLDLLSNSEVSIRSYNLDTGVNTTLNFYDSNGARDGLNDGYFSADLACGIGDDHAYFSFVLLENIGNSTQLTTTRILKINLSDGEISLMAEFDTVEGDPRFAGIEWMGEDLLAYPDFGERLPLYRVNTTTGNATVIQTDSDRYVSTATVDPESGTIYVVGINTVYQLDPGETSYRILSFDPTEESLNFSGVSSAAVDRANNQLLVSDWGLDAILGIDLDTGERRQVVARNQGEGVEMRSPGVMSVTEDQRYAYVLDNGGNAEKQFFRVDLATGNRELVGDISRAPGYWAADMLIDDETGVAYIALNNSVLEVNLETDAVSTLASESFGFGPAFNSISGMVLDKTNDRLLISDPTLEAIIELNLRTLSRSVFSERSVAGISDPFAGIAKLALDADNNRLFAINQQTMKILSFDLETGEGEVFLDTCVSSSGQDVLGTFGMLRNLSLVDGELLIQNDSINKFNFASGECTSLGFIPWGWSFRSLTSLDEGLYLFVNFDGVGLFDEVSRQYVFVSE